MHKERTTMVNQLNRMITIDTVHDTKSHKIGFEITENNNNEIISTQQIQVTREMSDTEIEEKRHQVPETRRIVQGSPAKKDNKLPPKDTIQISDTNIEDGENIQPVPATRRIVHKAKLKEKVNSTSTDMTERLKENIRVQPNAQNIDTRLLLGSKDTLTVEAFLTIIREYNSLNGSPLTAFKLCSHIWEQKRGSFFRGVFLPQKLVLLPPIESQNISVQRHVSSY
jgi:hypothetical protein